MGVSDHEILIISENPFLFDPIIVKFLAKADVSSLKKLRKLNMKWNSLNVKELERRASGGLLNPINLTSTDTPERIPNFLDDTRSNPLIFRSFRLEFDSLKSFDVLSQHFPIFLRLDFKHKFQKVIIRKVIRLLAPEIQELEIRSLRDGKGVNPLIIEEEEFQPDEFQPSIFPKLTRFAYIDHYGGSSDRWTLLNEFKFLMKKGGVVDPTPNLTNLEINRCDFVLDQYIGLDLVTPNISRWSRLSHLKLTNYNRAKYDTLTSILYKLGQAGMTLELLDLSIMRPSKMEWPLICENLSRFFPTQAKSLKTLDLTCIYFQICQNPAEFGIINAKIRLPIFENVRSLKIHDNYRVSFIEGIDIQMLLMMGPIPIHFPNLDHLIINNCVLLMYPEGIPVQSIPLKTLSLLHNCTNENPFDPWNFSFADKFHSVVNFRCKGSLLQQRDSSTKKSCFQNLLKFLGLAKVDGRKLPWKESLKNLEINGVECQLRLSHLKGLEKLTVSEMSTPECPEKYLSFFKHVRRLKLKVIIFIFAGGIKISDQDKAKFIRYFPYPVIIYNFALI